MFEFLGRGKGKPDESAHGTDMDTDPATIAQSTQLATAQHEEVVRFTLYGLLKMHGIPANCFAVSILNDVTTDGQQVVTVQLELLRWNDALVLHSFALQKQLETALIQFDTTVTRPAYNFTWKFSPQHGSPRTHLPGADYWTSLQTPVPAIPDESDDDDQGFAPTQSPETDR